MANKQLTAKVKLNTKQAEQAIERLSKKLNNLTKNLNKVSGGGSAEATVRKISHETAKQNTKLTEQISKHKIINHLTKSKLNMMKTQSRTMDTMLSKLKAIGAAYLGVMGFKTATRTSDVLTSAQNRLEYVQSQPGTTGSTTTAEAMDKMYASSQKVRMSYSDMLANVSKSMTLAGSAFQGNIDNAIRFQEVMAEAYSVGGASAAEMSSSMYQLMQALGSGILAGDELRSVREGAPLAYKKIEEFAQGVFNTTESLKELASQGKITSDIVVQAIMGAGNELDVAFANTRKTFGQFWDQVKNMAVRAFLPVSNMISEDMNNALNGSLLPKLESFFVTVSNLVMQLYTLVKNVITWIADNWNWLKYIVYTALGVMGAMIIKNTAVAVAGALLQAAAWAIANWQLVLAIGLIVLIITHLEIFMGVVAVVGAFIYNTVVGVINGIMQLAHAFIQPFLGIIEFIGNACMGGFNSFGDAVANLIGNIISWFLDLGKVVTRIIDAIFGSDWTTGLTNLQNNVLAWGKNEKAITISHDIPELNRIEYGSAWDAGKALGDKLTPQLNLGGAFPKPGLDTHYDPNMGAIQNIDTNTGKIADSTQMTADDLKYLRDLAEVEWKKEYTTASIVVEMNNDNTINGDGDLDGIVTKLSDKLYEEMSVLANGSYAYTGV